MHILEEHKKKYLTRRLVEIEELKASLDADDFEFAKIIGHRLKGNGETFGYPRISLIGISIEKLAIAKDRVKLQQAINELAQHVEEDLKMFH